MRIRTRLTLFSSIIFGVVFAVASAVVYVAFNDSSEKLIFSELSKTCNIAAFFYLEKDELPMAEYRKVEEQFEQNILSAEVRIFNERNEIRYGVREADPVITPALLDRVRSEEQVRFRIDHHYYYGIFYPDNQGDFVIFIKEGNEIYRTQLQRLMAILGIVLLIGLGAIILLSRTLSDIAYRPIAQVIDEVKAIGPDDLGRPIRSTGTNDEVQQLIDNFNHLLKRLSDTFLIQKNFVKYVSHEFKTPLAAISGNLEVFAQRDRTAEEYREVVAEALRNVYHIEDILNTLIMLSGLHTENTGAGDIRMDELLWEAIRKLQTADPRTEVSFRLDVPSGSEPMLTVRGNATQLGMAIHNILENAVKYSDGRPVSVRLHVDGDGLRLDVTDMGKGIPEAELGQVFRPFFRGSNTGNVKGSGIGLSLAMLIMRQHGMGLTIDSEVTKGTTVSVTFPQGGSSA